MDMSGKFDPSAYVQANADDLARLEAAIADCARRSNFPLGNFSRSNTLVAGEQRGFGAFPPARDTTPWPELLAMGTIYFGSIVLAVVQLAG